MKESVGKKTRTKKQHYIAQCLLRVFVDGDNIYESITDENKIYKSSIENSMCKSNSYESKYFLDNHLENFFADNIDGESAMVSKNIIKLLNSKSPDIDKIYNLFFNSVHLTLANYYKSITSLTRFGIDDGVTDDASIVSMLLRILNKDYIKRLCRIFKYCYNFAIIKSLDGDFILCDQFIATCSTKYKGMFSNISSRDVGVKDTMVFIPLNCYYYIVFYDGDTFDLTLSKDKVNILSDDQILKVNTVVYSNAFKKVVSSKNTNMLNLRKQNSSYGDGTVIMKYEIGGSSVYRIKPEVFLNDNQKDFYKYYQKLEWASPLYKMCGRNEKCPCGSQIKYKKCCKNKVDECWTIFRNQQLQKNIIINDEYGIEEPVPMPNTVGKEIREQVEQEIKQRKK